MLGSCDLVGFVSTTDASRARRFYEQTLGLTLEEERPFACVFRAHNAMLRVTVVSEVAPAPYTVLGWGVPDIKACVSNLEQRGVRFLRFDELEQDELGVWCSPSGARVAWFKDPDGNMLSLTEFAYRAG